MRFRERIPEFLSGLVVIVVVGVLAGHAYGAPPSGDAVRQEIESVPMLLSPTPEAPLSVDLPYRGPMEVKNGQKIKVSRIVLRGNTVFGSTPLGALVSSCEGREVSLAELNEAANRITAYYQNAGYYFARAYVPAQEIKDGVVQIDVLEGYLGEIFINGNEKYTDCYVLRHLCQLRKEGAIRYPTLERSLLLLNDNLGLKSKAVLKAGKELGTTDLYLELAEGDPLLKGYFDYNNFGSRYSSQHRFGFQVEFGNLTKHGDVLSLRGVVGSPIDQLFYGKVNYALPVGCYGTKAGASFTAMRYEVGKEFKILDMSGETNIYSFYVTHPLLRSQGRNLTVEGAFDHKSVRNYVFSDFKTGDDTLSVFKVGANYDELRWGGRNYVSGYLHQGVPDFLGSLDSRDPESSRGASGAGGDFTKLTLDLGHLRKIKDFAYLLVRAGAQVTSDDLVIAEQFSIGGPDSVRGYPMSEYQGDKGYTLSAELRVPVFQNRWKDRVQVVGFLDYGEASLLTPLVGEDGKTCLFGGGLGLRLSLPWETNVRVDLGFPLNDYEPSTGDSATWYFQVVKFF